MKLQKHLLTLLFLAFAAMPHLQAQCDGGSVSTSDDLTQVYTCPGDSNDDVLSFQHTTTTPDVNYAYVVTDAAGVILGLPPANQVNFKGAGSGTCLVWGLAYSGNITASVGDTATAVALSDGCFDLSDNFVTVIRDMPDGGTVATASGDTTVYTCPGDAVADLVEFSHETNSNARYAYVVTDQDGNILGLPPGNSVDFDGAGSGTCLVWGLSYTGNITAQAGDNALAVALTDDCFDLSDNFITVIRDSVDGGTVAMPSGEIERNTCAGDGEADVVMFTHETASNAQYAYVVTDQDGNILGLPPGNSVDFEGAGGGVCLVWGLSYTGNVTAQVGDNALEVALTDDCFDLSDNFITINRTGVDGGMVTTAAGDTTIYTCPGDSIADVIEFAHTTSSNENYAYVVTDADGNILGLPPGNEVNFEGAGSGTCLVWGLSYTGTITAQAGDNALQVALSDGCFALSDNYVTVIRDSVDGGTVAMPSGATERNTCAGDGEADVVMFTHETASNAQYAYVVTDQDGNILGLPPGNSVDFEGAGEGICLVWGLSYTGNVTAQVGDNALQVALTDDCFDLSDNFITINRTSVDGGMVAMPSGETEIETCAGDGEADVVMFTHTTTSSANYAYVVTDADGNILGLPPGNSVDFEGAGEGVCLVWGLSYTGNVTAQVGDNALEIALTDACFDLSENFITVTRTGVDGGMVAMPSGETEIETCAGDGEADVVMFTHTTTSSANYAYVVTDEDGNILGLPPGNSVDFEGAGEGVCLVWGLSYTGTITAQVGDNALEVAITDGCFDLSDNFITVNRTGVDGGMVAMPSGATERTTCAGDGEADVVMFTHTTTSSANYAYVVTDEAGNILGLPPGNSVDFEGAGEGVCLVWGLSYTGMITAQVGDNALEVALTDACFDLSDNFITVTRTGVDGGTVSTDNGDNMILTCAGDGMADIVTFAHESSSSANYAYVVTDADGNILGLPPGNSLDFDGAGAGTCLVWGLSYTGTITAQPGDNALEVALTDGCFDLSENFITVERNTNCSTGFTLINADTDEELTTINNGDVINISDYGVSDPNRLNIRSDFTGDLPASVVFSFDDEEVFNIEQIVPFALGGDNNGDYHPTGAAFSLGAHTVTASPFWSYQGMGVAGTPATISFTITSGSNRVGRTSNNFNLYPNPTNGNIRIDMPEGESGRVQIQIFNIVGDKVQVEAFDVAGANWSRELNVSTLPTGTYIVQILNGNIQKTTRLVKN